MPARFAAAACLIWLGAAQSSHPRDEVTMCKLVNGECGQFHLDRKVAEMPIMKVLKIQNCNCKDEGYPELDGSKEMNIPMLGEVKVMLFKKPDLLDLAMQVGTDFGLLGACCKTCEVPKVKHVSVDTTRGRCGESCVDPDQYWIFKMFDEKLKQADDQTCSSLGYKSYNRTVTKGVPPAGLTIDIYTPLPDTMSILYNIVGGMCGEALMNKSSEPMALRAGLAKGTCMQAGYAEPAGTKDMDLPMLGQVRFGVFRKAGDLDVVDAFRVSMALVSTDGVTLYKISADGSCGQVNIDKKFKQPAEQFAQLKEGNCKDQGYAAPAGSKSIDVPVLGHIEASLFKKAAVGPAPDIVV